VGSISHVSGVLFNAQFGFKPALVAYRGTNPALNDLVGGQIDYMVDQSLNVIPQIKAARSRSMPSRAGAARKPPRRAHHEGSGRRTSSSAAWNAMVAPKGTPPEIVDKLAAALGKALDDPVTVKRYVELASTRRRAPSAGRPACRSWSRPDGAHHAGPQGSRGRKQVNCQSARSGRMLRLMGSRAGARGPFSPWGEGARRADEGGLVCAQRSPPSPVRPE